MRRASQLFFLLLFTALFCLNPFVASLNLTEAFFLKTNPFLSLCTVLSSRALHINLLWSLPVLISAVLAGRFFCGYICPLGTLFDLAPKRTENAKTLVPPRYIIAGCVLLISCAAAGLNLGGFFDPLAFLTRLYTFFAYPALVLLADAGLDAVRPAAEKLRWTRMAYLSFARQTFCLVWLTVFLGAVLFFLNYLSQRFWCRGLCPLGGLLSLVSRLSLIKRNVSDACTGCGRCITACTMQAIPSGPRHTQTGSCILCNDCVTVCPEQAIRLAPASEPHHVAATSIGRRGIIVSATLGVLTALIPRMNARATGDMRLIRPPGALPEPLFLPRCIRCGECMKVCPTNTLQPCLFEAGLDGLWTPRVVPRHAGCDQTCRLCGTVCPTGALRNLSLEEKKHAKIGTAYIDTDRCLVWARDRLCLICDEQCPYNAIVFAWEGGSRKPFVVDAKCNGCGFCEQACPVDGRSAILVTRELEIRLRDGSYVQRARQLQITLEEDPGDDVFFRQKAPDG